MTAPLVPRAPAPEHLHDFGSGSRGARCMICKLTVAEAGVQSGGRVVGPRAGRDDGWRAPEPPTIARALQGPPIDEQPPLTRIDVVAQLHGIVRRPGEDEASLATRIRRLAGTFRPAIPPLSWAPPPGFRLGIDRWQDAQPALPGRRAAGDVIDLGDGMTLEL